LGLTVVATLAACAGPALAGSYTFTNINTPPSGIGSQAYGINDGGAILGYSEAPVGFGNAGNPFVDVGGSFTFLNFPGGTFGNIGFGINNSGQVVGTYNFPNDPNLVAHAFLYSGSNIQNIDPPVDPSQLNAAASAINNRGQIVITNLNNDGSNSNFLYANGQFTPLTAIPPSGVANGINDAGTIVGTTTDANNVKHGFTLKNGLLTQLDDPNAGTAPFFNGTQANAINNNGAIVGYYGDATNNTHGFVYQNGVFTTLDDPFADTWNSLKPLQPSGTEVLGINDQGQVVGFYYYMTGTGPNPRVNVQAFLATPVPEPGSLALVTIAGIVASGWRFRRRNELTR
jgi:probable HAF family extracellular repeat protein